MTLKPEGGGGVQGGGVEGGYSYGERWLRQEDMYTPVFIGIDIFSGILDIYGN